MKDNKGLLYLVLSGLFISTSPVFAQHLVKSVPVKMLMLLWFVSAAAVSTVIVIIYQKLNPLSYFKNNWKEGLILGFVNALASGLWFASISLIGASLTTFLLRFMTIFLIGFGILFLREKLGIREIIGAIIAIAGAFLINFETDNLLIFGTLIALLAAFIIAVQEFIGKIYVARIKPVVLASMRTTFTLPFLLVFAASTGSISTVSSGNLTLIIIGSTLSAAIGFIFWYKALETTDVSKAAIIRTLDPFIVLAYAFMIFRTTPKIPELIGGTLIVAGVILSELRLGKVKDALKILPL